MDGFDVLGRVKMIMATNRPDTLDPALLRPGRLDRKIGKSSWGSLYELHLEIPLPNEQARLEILKIHAQPIAKAGEIDYEAIVKLSDDFNGADLRNICTEAGTDSRLQRIVHEYRHVCPSRWTRLHIKWRLHESCSKGHARTGNSIFNCVLGRREQKVRKQVGV